MLDCGLWALARLWAILAVGAASFWILDASDAPKPRTCQTVGSGLCETVGGVAQAVGSGLWRAKSFFSSGPKLPFKRLKPLKPLKRFDTCHGCAIRLDSGRFRRSKTSHLLDCGLWALCQTVGHTGRWSSQLLDSGRFRRSKTSHLPDCGLWALRDCGRSCAGCGLGACTAAFASGGSLGREPLERAAHALQP